MRVLFPPARRRLAGLMLVVAGCHDPVETPDPKALAMVSVTPSAATLVAGQELQLTGVALDRSRNPLPEEPVTWSSSDPAVASVSAAGLVSPLAAGAVEIRGTAGEVRASARVTVLEGAWLGPAGGTVTALDGGLTLVVPENALSAPLAIQVERIESPTLDPTATDAAVQVRFAGTLAAPAQLTLGYAPATGPAGVPEAALGMRRLEVAQWRPVEASTVDPANDVASAPISAPGTYGVGRLPPTAPCSAPEHRQFDFWLGRWAVVPTGSPPGTREAHSFITAEPGGCAVMEDFRDLDVRGESISVYDPGTGQWFQTYVDNTGSRLVLGGELVGADLILADAESATRVTWSVSGGEVRQLFEGSTDGGTTWDTTIDLTYGR